MSINRNTPPLPEGECNCDPPHGACSKCQGVVKWRLKVNDDPHDKDVLTMREELWACKMELEAERQISSSREEEIKRQDIVLEKYQESCLKLKARVKELDELIASKNHNSARDANLGQLTMEEAYGRIKELESQLKSRIKDLEEQVKYHKDDAKRVRDYWRNNETPGGDFNMLDPNNMAGP